MRRGIASVMILVLLPMSLLILAIDVQPVKANSTILVPDDYEKIQWAIGNASVGDTIFVRTGTYYEEVTVNKSVALIGARACGYCNSCIC